jgi:peptidoglycan-associated lipoprotein
MPLARDAGMMRVSRWLAILAALLVGLPAVPAGAQSPAAVPAMVRVVKTTAILRWFPHTPDEVIGTAEDGTTLDVLGREQGWYWIMTTRDANGSRRGGWIAAGDVEPYVEEPAASAQEGAPAPAAAAPPAETPAPRPPQPNVARAPAAPPAPAPDRKTYQFQDVLFDLDRFAIRTDAMATLDSVTAAMQGDPGLRITLEGNTCDLGTVEHNLGLGEKRATAVRDYLMSHGVPASRLNVVSFGETHPKYDNTKTTRHLNRRVAIVPEQ